MKITGPFRDRRKQRRGYPKFWYLSVVSPATTADGAPDVDANRKRKWKRERPCYKTREAAEADIPRLRAQHEVGGVGAGGMLSRAQLEDVEGSRKVVPESEASHLDLANFWRMHHPAKDTKRLKELLKPFLDMLELRNGKTAHYVDLKNRLARFLDKFGERFPGTITHDEVMTYLLGLAVPSADGKTPAKSGRTVLNQKRAVCNFFSWLLSKGYVKANPAAGIKKRELPKIRRKEIRFLSIVYTRCYLDVLQRYDPELVAHEVVQLFSGVRSDDEMGNFRAEWVLSETKEIVIPEEHAKMSDRRDVISLLEDNFWVWWKEYGPTEGLLRPSNYEQRWYRLRVLAHLLREGAFEEIIDELARLPIKTLLGRQDLFAALEEWPWNARRRTFCTYHVAKYESADKTALILRHKGKASVLHDSYRGLGVAKYHGEAYFKLVPFKPTKVIRPELPARGIIRLQEERAAKAAEAAKAVSAEAELEILPDAEIDLSK